MIKRGGRVKGTPNRKTQDLLEMCMAKGCSPFEVLIELCGKDYSDDMRLSAAKELCQYLYPKRKAIEHSGSINHELAKEAEEIQALSPLAQIKLLEEALAELKANK